MKNLILLLSIAAIISSCGIFKKTERHSEKSESDSSIVIKKSSNSLDTSKSSSYQRWVFLLPSNHLGEPIKPFEPNFGTSVMDLSKVMEELKNSHQPLAGESPTSPAFIPLFYDRFDTGQKGISVNENEKSKESFHRENENKDVVTKPDYSWIPYLLGTLAIIIFAGIFIRKWSLR